jgi:HrpA-like RNA helicase
MLINQSIKGGDVMVLALHSALSTGDQHLVFDRPPKGTTKVIIFDKTIILSDIYS